MGENIDVANVILLSKAKDTKERQMKLKVKSEDGKKKTQKEPSPIKMSIEEKLEKEILANPPILKNKWVVPETNWAISVNKKPFKTWNRFDRWETKEQAREALQWHCEYGLWLADEHSFKPKEIEEALDKLIERGIIEIEYVK